MLEMEGSMKIFDDEWRYKGIQCPAAQSSSEPTQSRLFGAPTCVLRASRCGAAWHRVKCSGLETRQMMSPFMQSEEQAAELLWSF